MMRNRINRFKFVIAAACIMTGSLLGLSACGKSQPAEIVPETVENFTLDFESGDFSFDFNGECKSFYVRVFSAGEQDETMPLAARRVRYRSEQTEYSGTMNLSDLQPGDTFDAYVYTYVKDDNGDLHYSCCEPLTGIYKTSYKTPSKKISLNMVDGQAVANLEDGFFTDQYLDKTPQYKVTLYKGDQEVDSKVIGYDDLEIVETVTQNFFGGEEISTSTTAKLVFAIDDAGAEYFITVQILSTDDVAYYDSLVSEKIPVTEPVVEEPVEEGADMMGEGMGFGDGNF